MTGNQTPFWPADWIDPSLERAKKPRRHGLTMVIDKGLGPHSFADLMSVASAYMDVYKLGFGTCALYPPEVLRQKLEAVRESGIAVMPGGTFFEVACALDGVEAYLARIREWGFNAVEISEGTLPLTREERRRAIALAADAGLRVYTEFGKKTADFAVEPESLMKTLEADLAAGAEYVIVEARESGNVGVFNSSGKLDRLFLREIVEAAGPLASRLIWEAPGKEQQVALMEILGYEVNLGNIAPCDVLSVEALRRGLRGDTTAAVLAKKGTIR